MSSKPSVPTWRSGAQFAWITELSKGKTDALEIGTFCGAGSRALLEGVSGLVFSIEPLGYSSENQEQIETEHEHLEHWIQELALDYPERFIHIAGRSEHQIWFRPIDVLLLDGDHSFGGVIGDAHRFAPYVTDGGIVFIDAYGHHKKPKVKPAWDEFMAQTSVRWEHIGNERNLHAWVKHQAG